MKTKQVCCLMLALLMIVSAFVGCADNATDEPHSTDTNAVSNEASEEETELETDPVQNALDALKDTVDWEGKNFGVLYADGVAGYDRELEAENIGDGDTDNAGILNDAVYERNTRFEEYCNLNFVPIPTTADGFSTKLIGEIQAATGDFVLMTHSASATASLAVSGYLYDLLDLNINYDQPWWDEGPQSFSLKGHIYMMNGPFNFVDDDVTFVMMFNKDLGQTYKIANPYDNVKDGTWTMDYFYSLMSGLAMDDGNHSWGAEDTYGFASPESFSSSLFYGAGLRYISNSTEQDMPELMLTGSQMDKALTVHNIAQRIVSSNDSFIANNDETLQQAKAIFESGRSLFYSEAASYVAQLNASMTSDFGVLPIPKYHAEQENYYTWAYPNASVVSLPTSVGNQDTERLSKTLDVYALLSEQLIKPTYYDVLLTTRNVRDPESSEIIDMIFSHRVYDMAMYFTDLNIGGFGTETFASDYAAATRTFDRKVERLLEKIEARD